jgi:hypothetical protein
MVFAGYKSPVRRYTSCEYRQYNKNSEVNFMPFGLDPTSVLLAIVGSVHECSCRYASPSARRTSGPDMLES